MTALVHGMVIPTITREGRPMTAREIAALIQAKLDEMGISYRPRVVANQVADKCRRAVPQGQLVIKGSRVAGKYHHRSNLYALPTCEVPPDEEPDEEAREMTPVPVDRWAVTLLEQCWPIPIYGPGLLAVGCSIDGDSEGTGDQ